MYTLSSRKFMITVLALVGFFAVTFGIPELRTIALENVKWLVGIYTVGNVVAKFADPE